MAEDDHIDALLARYLELLDTYTKLRAELSELQSSVYHSLARANFSTERGIRYGQDFYDDRMQATKVITTEYSEDGLPSFTLLDLNATTATDTADSKVTETADIVGKMEQTTLKSDEKDDSANAPAVPSDAEESPKTQTTRQPKFKDPLRWFGILSPPFLRQAQSSASALVETAVKLSNVDGEMKGVEIEIRRARKRKAKNENPVDGAGKVAKDAEVVQLPMVKSEKANRGGGCARVAI